jgi:hypothetical protein
MRSERKPEGSSAGDDRIEVTRAEQLPLRTDPVPRDLPDVFHEDGWFRTMAEALARDLKADLARYKIADPGILKGFRRTLAQVAWYMRGRDEVLGHLDAAAALETKPGPRVATGLLERAILTSGGQRDPEALRRELRTRSTAIPPEAQAELKTLRGRLEIATAALALGDVRARIGPVAEAGAVSRELAQSLVGARHYLDVVEPLPGRRRAAAPAGGGGAEGSDRHLRRTEARHPGRGRGGVHQLRRGRRLRQWV